MELCAKHDLYVIVRPGPYVCAEWDFGGMPSYLLKEMSAYIRRYDETYVRAYRRYIEALAIELLP